MPPRKFGFGRGYRWVTDFPPSPQPYETIVRARRVPIPMPKPPYGAMELTRLRNIEYGRRIMRERQAVLLARADSARRLRQFGETSGTGRVGVSPGVDLLKKVKSMRPGQNRLLVPYKGPGTLGPLPSTSPMGHNVLKHIQQQKKAQARIFPPGDRGLGSCWRRTVSRMKAGWMATYGSDLLAGRTQEQKRIFDAIAGSRPGTYPQLWRNKVPKNLRYRGVPGALNFLGAAEVIEGDAVWRGELEPGAPVQIWEGRPGLSGHSAVFERYIRDKKGTIVGLVTSDQWLDYKMYPRRKGILAPKIIGAKFKR